MNQPYSDEDIVRVVSALPVHLSRRRMLGSQLGTALRRAALAQGLQFSAQAFGGLRAFAERYLTDLVVRVTDDPSAQDDKYDILAALPDNDDTNRLNKSDWRPTSGEDNLFWTLYSNPSATAQFAVTDDDAFRFTQHQTICPAGWQPIEKVQASDYVNFASKFLATVDEPERHELETILRRESADKFYRPWHQALRQSADRQATKKWEIFRVSSVQQHLREQLDRSSLPGTVISQVLNNLKQSQAFGREVSSSARRPVLLLRGADSSDQHEAEKFRAILSVALDQLSLNQLSAISLPVGVTINTLRRLKLR